MISVAPLQREVRRWIVDRALAQIQRSEGFEGRNLNLQIDQEVLDYIGKKGYNARYGARFLQRTLREKMIIPLSHELNQFPFQTPLDVRIFLEDNALNFDIKKRKTLSLLDQYLPGDKETTVEQFLNQTTALRRLTFRIMEANVYTNLLSEFDQLERQRRYLKKRKREEEFWQNGIKGKKYMSLMELKAKMEEILGKIEDFEIENLLLAQEEKMHIEEQLAKDKAWKKSFNELKIQLIQQTGEPYSTCCLGVYGTAVHLENLFKVYHKILEAKGYEYKGFCIWFDPNHKDETKKYTRKKLAFDHPDDQLLVGFEIEIQGDLAFLFLQGEGGFIKWFDKHKSPKNYFVSIQKGNMKDFGTPDGVHRQRFFQQQDYRRRYHPSEGLKDTRYHAEVPSKHFAKELLKLLNTQLDHALTRQLTSMN